MNFMKIYKNDFINGLGVRVSLFVSGCNLHCEGCFNSEAWNFRAGNLFTLEKINSIIELMNKPYVSGLSILGGEPFDQLNSDIDILVDLCNQVREMGKNIWIWSGHTFEELIKNPKALELLNVCDVLVDGPFIQEQKDLTLAFRGSKNQRIIDVQNSLKENKLILL